MEKAPLMQQKRSVGLNKKRKGFLSALSMAIKKDATMSIRKHANELKVYEKIVKRVMKQDISPDLNSLDNAMWGVILNKTMQFPSKCCSD